MIYTAVLAPLRRKLPAPVLWVLFGMLILLVWHMRSVFRQTVSDGDEACWAWELTAPGTSLPSYCQGAPFALPKVFNKGGQLVVDGVEIVDDTWKSPAGYLYIVSHPINTSDPVRLFVAERPRR
ncbi:MAG: hypothetical protein WCF85_19535 [Rhodospirillaceae bacterium]